MSEIKYLKGKNSTRTGSIFSAVVIYSFIALEVLIGDLPSKHAGISSTFYEENAGFFWVVVGLEMAYGLYLLIGGIRRHRQLIKNVGNFGEAGISGISQMINFFTMMSAFIVGLCFLILPIIEITQTTVYGGLIFKNHRLIAEPSLFWQLWFFHLLIAFLPIMGGVLLVIFSPKKIQPINV